jgi:predicted permease
LDRILGVPISTAVFGNPQLGFKYGILAGVSSFIFQLPLQLFFLECHTLNESAQEPTKDDEIQDETKIDDVITDKKSPNGSEELEESDIEKNGEDDVGAESNMQEMPKFPSSRDDNKVQQDEAVTKLSWLKMLRSGDVWRKITLNVLQNPVLWAIAVGFILTLSTVGPRFLNPNGTDYVPGLGWIFITLSWMGDCVSPVSLFAMGVWMQKEWKSLFAIPVWSACLYMISKLVLVPLIMVFLAMAVHLDDQSARAAVLISSLPISLASFVLASRYKIGEAILSENVALGTILILPTVLIWNMVLDEVGVFLIPENGL